MRLRSVRSVKERLRWSVKVKKSAAQVLIAFFQAGPVPNHLFNIQIRVAIFASPGIWEGFGK